MKILYLTLKGRWFDMIASGEKPEEYRDIKMYWWKRLVQCGECYDNFADSLNDVLLPPEKWKMIMAQNYDAIRFARGGHFHPSIPQMTVVCNEIKIGTGKPEWGAEPGKEYFVIKLGEIIKGPA